MSSVAKRPKAHANATVADGGATTHHHRNATTDELAPPKPKHVDDGIEFITAPHNASAAVAADDPDSPTTVDPTAPPLKVRSTS